MTLLDLNRRINAILYLNPGWQDGWGGEFGLYDETGDKLIKKIAPIHNRLVVFDTNDKSFHGLPDPLNFPRRTRKKVYNFVLLYKG
jgi:Rps23 Pro-64 3,4-dihydroxylase Tpa1-like proline 4-hydroxylase